MKVDGKPFIDYSDFHLPFHTDDIVNLEAIKQSPDVIKQYFPFGEGIGDLLTDQTTEKIINSSLATDAEGEAIFKIDTLLIADEGKPIKGEDIYQIIQEAKKKKVTIASLAHKIPDTSIKCIISPGPGVVEQAPRSNGRKKTSKKDSY